ncbi:hypothetical protein AVEN_55232-1 [Araneus ventricosus]|uniref:Uncharacterized protein n=1 Tax=Araneus ventricosus TaxID=182803 RepID=A0A4Y2KEU1_ARAVE|nr:hypothetical protein AVEN_55232-1 [Araneus ventricosus]
MGLNIKINADDLFIVAERVNRAVGSGVTVGHIDELEKGLSGNDVVLKGGMNAGKLCLVEDSGSGGLGLPSSVVVGLNYDGLYLRKPRCLKVMIKRNWWSAGARTL